MKKSLYRPSDSIELLLISLLCFLVNTGLAFADVNYKNESTLLADFIKSIVQYRFEICGLLSVLVIIYFYQFIKRKQTEIFLRYMVGSQIKKINLRFFYQSVLLLAVSFLIAEGLSLFLGLSLSTNLFLFILFLIYAGISTMWVKVT